MFIILPVGVDYRARRYPVVTFTLMGICVAIYLITLACEIFGDTQAVHAWVYEYLWLIPDEHHWWTFITHQFVHGGLFHVAGNMVYLFLFGSCVEDIIGRLRFIIFYLLCGIVAALTHLLVSSGHFDSSVPMGGASGAISGCIGGFLLLMLKTSIDFKWIFFLYFRVWSGDFQLPAWLVITFWFLEDLGLMVLTVLVGRHGGGVAFAAHVGGTLAGLGLMSLQKWRMKIIGIDRVPAEDIEEEETPVVTAPTTLTRAQRAALASQSAPQPRYRVGLNAAAVPVTPASEAATIHLSWSGSQSGPFTPSQLQQMFAAGEIPADAFYWQEGMADWRPAEELREPGTG